MSYTVNISKDRFKFSASHFTIFSKEVAERLHGHNYQVSVDITFKHLNAETGISAEFSELKKIIQTTCDKLDEKFLLPSQSSFIELTENNQNLEVQYNQRFYSFPKEDCEVLELVNTSSECLAQWIYNQLKPELLKAGAINFSVELQETRGQSVTFREDSIFIA